MKSHNYLDDSGISLPVFPSRTNLKLHNISVTTKMVKKVITNLDSSKVSGPDYIPVVDLKNCEPEISCILVELFNMCQKGSCFQDCWKVLLVHPVFKNFWKGLQLKSTTLLVFFSMVSKVFEKLLNSRIVGDIENCGSDFQYGFMSSCLTANLLTIVSKAFDRVLHAGILHKLKSYVISGQVFGLIFLFSVKNGFWWFWIGIFYKNTQLMLDAYATLYVNDIPDDVICNITIYADDTTLYPKFD